ncbi:MULTISPECIES: TolC family protein [Helicobacter]|uniref:TolC family protein n=1 Tax=Helicobacter ibis TaxID=2962633 RepID=A0ABT4VED0_9HELI|nr:MULTISPECIES: TolC family protein [Helicobacter]MDA3967495.1 TolC family protein [Helicobacter sp. WB40]MDA3969065.1 TolC family protein [Helicobacter ibis]
MSLNVFLRFFVLFAVFFLSACVTIPSNSELSKNIPTSFNNESLIQTSKDTKVLSPEIQLYYLFEDENLRNLYDIALLKNINLQIMQSRILQAESALKVAFSEFFPKDSASFGGSKSKGSGFQTQALGNLSWEIDVFGKNTNAKNSKESLYKKSMEDFRATQITLLSDVTSLYFNLQEYNLNISLTKENITHYAELLELTRLKVENGLLDSTELFTKQDLLTNEQNTLEILKKQFEESKNALLILLDLKSLPFVLSPSFSYKDDFLFSFEKIPANAILSRPDIRANIYSLYSQIYNKSEAYSSLFPIISISGNVSEVLQNNSNIAWSIASSISAPIFNRTQLTQNYFLQNELLKENYLSLQDSLNNAFFEIENSLFNIKNTQIQTKNNYLRFKNAQDYFMFATNRRSIGLIDELELRENNASLNNSKKNLYSSLNAQSQSLIMLFKAFGGNLYIEGQ